MKVAPKELKSVIGRIFSIRVLLPLAIVSLLLLGIVAFWKLPVVQFGVDLLSNFSDQVQPKSLLIVKLSETEASASGELVLSFELEEKDKDSFDDLAKKLGLGQTWPKNISLGLDDVSVKNLQPLLPLKLNINLLGNTLTFKNSTIHYLGTSKVSNEYYFASQSASIKLREAGIKDVDLEIKNLKLLINESTKSGKLYLSPVLLGLEVFWKNVDSVWLQIKGDRMQGQVKFF